MMHFSEGKVHYYSILTDHTQQNVKVNNQAEERTLMKVGRHTLKVVLIWLKSPGGMEHPKDTQGFLSSLQLWETEKNLNAIRYPFPIHIFIRKAMLTHQKIDAQGLFFRIHCMRVVRLDE